MKKVIWILALIILSNIAIAQTYELINHVPIIINGKTFELDGRGENQVYVRIDGKITKVTELYEYRNGVFLQLIDYNDPYDNNPLIATITIVMDYVCGNKVCELGEKDSCCTDCNCTAGYTCTQNQCIDSKLNECFNNSDCNDNNPCTIDFCSGIPMICNNTFFSDCVSGDDCCPIDCNKTLDYINNDLDCLPKPECWTDFDCNDSDETTIDLCDKKEKFCKFEIMMIKGQPVRIEESVESEILLNNSDEIKINKTNSEFKLPVILILILIILFISIKIFKKYKNNKFNSDKEESKTRKKEGNKNRSSIR